MRENFLAEERNREAEKYCFIQSVVHLLLFHLYHFDKIAGAVADVAATCDQGEQAPLALAKAAHRLAGAASNFGFRGLFLLGQKIETLADPRDGAKPQGQAAVTAAATVPMVYEQTLQELDSWLARLPPV